MRAQGSSSSVSGNLTITATDKLTQQGAHHQAGGVYREQAASVEHLEANNRDSSRSQRTQVHGEAGVSVDYSAVTRPLEGAVKKGASLDANGVVNEIGTIGKPNLGIDVAADGGTHTQSSSDTQAQTTQIQAGAIQVTARDEVHDRGRSTGRPTAGSACGQIATALTPPATAIVVRRTTLTAVRACASTPRPARISAVLPVDRARIAAARSSP